MTVDGRSKFDRPFFLFTNYPITNLVGAGSPTIFKIHKPSNKPAPPHQQNPKPYINATTTNLKMLYFLAYPVLTKNSSNLPKN
ncbi:MAG: hypothetical protein HC849_20990 [Oscillatoriales cyanobacterium RU_3_3]|nr:hypothetical protein [Oscillatoriales cyanobacterium RU_3_3]